MNRPEVTRRELLKSGSAVAAAALLTRWADPAFAFPGQAADDQLVPFKNVPRSGPNRLDWETLGEDEWLTPQDQVFNVQHYGIPEVDTDNWQLQVAGLVDKPLSLSLSDLKQLPREDQLMTLECSGNGASPAFMNAVYNSRWTGTRLVPLLKSAGVGSGAKEIVFFGADHQEETLRKGTRRELTVDVPFGRSLDIDDLETLNPLLAYERNGQPLETRNGAPVRLIVPGWYGIANVKWLQRIELRHSRYMGRYMARDYVTVRGERQGDEVVFVESSVTRMNPKSIIARVTRRAASDGRIPLKAFGAVWDDGTGISSVEVRLDDGEWKPATLAKEPRSKFSWTFFSIDLGTVAPGEHTAVSRAVDRNGRVQPSAEDDEIALKRTYWEAYQQWPRQFEVEA